MYKEIIGLNAEETHKVQLGLLKEIATKPDKDCTIDELLNKIEVWNVATPDMIRYFLTPEYDAIPY